MLIFFLFLIKFKFVNIFTFVTQQRKEENMTKFLKTVGVCFTGALMATSVLAESSNSFPTGMQIGVGLSATSGLNGLLDMQTRILILFGGNV